MIAITETQEEIKKRKKGIGSENHSYIQARIVRLLDRKYLDTISILTELSLSINGSEKIPDIAIFKEFEFKPGKDIIKSEQLPLGVIEILSPTQSLTELVVKSDTYFDIGVKSYWLVAPDVETIYVYYIDGKRQTFAKEDKLIDKHLNIELELSDIFK